MKLRRGSPKEAGMSAQRVQYVVDLAKGWVDQGIMPALVILVARKDVIVAHEAFGCLTPERDSPPLELDTMFALASLTKPITATLAMILVEDGLLGLNRPVSWYIPEFVGEGKDSVMVHHLLTHTSGLRDEDVNAHAKRKRRTVKIPPPDDTQHPQVNENLFLGYDAPLWKRPGAEMRYCNYGYNLVGEIVRRVSGRSLDDFARERLFRPLGMKDSYFVVPDSVSHRSVRRSPDIPDAHRDTRAFQKVPWPRSGAHSTAMDMAIFGQMFLNGGSYNDNSVLSPATVTAMIHNQIPGISAEYFGRFFPEASWGFGWDVHGDKKAHDRGTLHSPKAFSHSGAGGVFLWVDAVYRITGVLFGVLINWEEGICIDLFMNAVTAAIVD